MPPYHVAGSPSISHCTNDHIMALNVEDREKHLLLIGPNMLNEATPTHSSLLILLKRMVSWCIQKKFISQYHTTKDFCEQYDKRPLKDTLIQFGYTIEENLSEKHQQQECLKASLEQRTPSVDKYRLLVRKPFRGYVTTAYDTFIETAYAEERQEPLLKFYISSIRDAIEACRNGQPFILKLYGDIDDPASIILGPRFIKGLSAVCELEQLRTLLSMSPVIFTGFEKADPDLGTLSSLTRTPAISPHIVTSKPVSSPETKYKLKIEHARERPDSNIACKPILDYVAITSLSETLRPISAAIENSPSMAYTQETQYSEATQKAKNASAIEIFTVYVPSDEQIKQGLADILCILEKQKWRLICKWGRATIEEEWKKHNYLKTSHLILLLVSRSFLKTDFCYSDEIKNAIR